MKRNKEVGVFKKTADSNKHAYTGPTMLSDMVCFKAKEIREDYCKLLSDDSGELEDILSMLPLSSRQQGRALFISLVLLQLALWDQRVMEQIS